MNVSDLITANDLTLAVAGALAVLVVAVLVHHFKGYHRG